jgi:hypothetical protein
MNRAAELDAKSPQKRPETGLPNKVQAQLVYCLEKQGMTVTLFSHAVSEPVIELALGTETRTFSLSEFLHFWLTIIEVGLKRDIAELQSEEVLRRIKRKR